METVITIPNIMFAIGMISLLFNVFFYFKNPQEDIEKKQLLTEKDLAGKATILAQNEANGKAELLAMQVAQERTANDKRFAEIGVRMDNATTLAQNHIHTIDTKVDVLASKFNDLTNQVTKLATIIEERIPKVQQK